MVRTMGDEPDDYEPEEDYPANRRHRRCRPVMMKSDDEE